MNISEAPIFPLLKGKVAIITQGAQGMGKTTAAAFLNSDEVENLIVSTVGFFGRVGCCNQQCSSLPRQDAVDGVRRKALEKIDGCHSDKNCLVLEI